MNSHVSSDLPTRFLHCSHVTSSTTNIPTQSSAFAPMNGSTWTDDNYPKPIVCVRTHYCFCTFHEFDKFIISCFQHQGIKEKGYLVLKCPLSSILSQIIPPNPMSLNFLLIFLFVAFPLLQCHVVGIMQFVAFEDWLLSLGRMHLKHMLCLS